MPQHVKVVGAPGFVEEFRAILIPGLHKIPAVDGRGELSVVTTEVGDIHVIPSKHVELTFVSGKWEIDIDPDLVSEDGQRVSGTIKAIRRKE